MYKMNNASIATAMVQAAQAAQDNSALLVQVRNIYRYAGAVIAAHKPLCHQSSRCCQFAKMEHNLFVTTVEFAYFLHKTAMVRSKPIAPATCPFLRLGPGRCAARSGRSLGCRMFYCDPNSQWWQQGLYNRMHGRLQQLHEQFNVPYYYAEWLTALRAAGTAVSPNPPISG